MRSDEITGLQSCPASDNLSNEIYVFLPVFVIFPGNPEPQLQWYLDGKAVMEGEYIMTMIHDITEREYHGCLQLDTPTHLNNGRYTLVATNKFGKDQKEVEAHFMHNPSDGEEHHCKVSRFLLLDSD